MQICKLQANLPDRLSLHLMGGFASQDCRTSKPNSTIQAKNTPSNHAQLNGFAEFDVDLDDKSGV
jgi:hypothetical protein